MLKEVLGPHIKILELLSRLLNTPGTISAPPMPPLTTPAGAFSPPRTPGIGRVREDHQREQHADKLSFTGHAGLPNPREAQGRRHIDVVSTGAEDTGRKGLTPIVHRPDNIAGGGYLVDLPPEEPRSPPPPPAGAEPPAARRILNALAMGDFEPVPARGKRACAPQSYWLGV